MALYTTIPLAVLAAGGWELPEPHVHPFLFMTADDVARAKRGVEEDPAFAALARELVERAREGKVEDLPPLERAWWEEIRDKPWADTYPEIFHYTWGVPSRWTKLAEACARASLLSGSEELAQKGRQVLLALADYTYEYEHYDVGMNYTVWTCRALDAYDMLYDGFSKAERRRLDAFFERALAAVVRNDEYWIRHEPGGPMNNHYAWHKLCRMMLGLFYGRAERVEEALYGPKGVEEMFRHGFTDDGLWLEGSIPYQFAATGAFLLMAEMLDNAGYPTRLWAEEIAEGRNLKQTYDAMIPLLFPDGVLPPIGDSYAARPHLGTNGAYETLYRRFGDGRHAWLIGDAGQRRPEALFEGVPNLPVATPPAQVSGLWPEHGYAALRSVEGPDYWEGRGFALFATYSNAPVHTNADKLSILLFADGHHWLPDCEAKASAEHAFSARVQYELNRETVCHNTLLVDGASQRHPSRRLELVEYVCLPEEKRVTMGDLDGRLYEGVRQLRTCIVRDGYVLDVFQVQASSERELAWLIHVDGNREGGSVEGGEPTTLPAGPPWSYLRDARRAGPVRSVWERFGSPEGGVFRYDLLADGPVEVVSCGFPREDTPDAGTVPMRMMRCRRSNAWFAAVYRSGVQTEDALSVDVRPGVLNSWTVALTLGATTRAHRVPMLERLP